jgi:hypothetical protein
VLTTCENVGRRPLGLEACIDTKTLGEFLWTSLYLLTGGLCVVVEGPSCKGANLLACTSRPLPETPFVVLSSFPPASLTRSPIKCRTVPAVNRLDHEPLEDVEDDSAGPCAGVLGEAGTPERDILTEGGVDVASLRRGKLK